MYRRFLSDFSVYPVANVWDDVLSTGLTEQKSYVVQTGARIIERCILMTTDPGDLVLDPTCGSGTTAYVAEQWGRRWITIDTSRVALALARARIMGARYPYYLLADSRQGQVKQAEIEHRAPSESPTSTATCARGSSTSACRTSSCAIHRQQHGDRRHLGGRSSGSWSRCGRT